MDTRKNRDDLHHGATGRLWDDGLIEDDDKKVFLNPRDIDNLKVVITRVPYGESMRRDEWTVEPSALRLYDAWLAAGGRVRLILECEVLARRLMVVYDHKGTDVRLEKRSDGRGTVFYAILLSRVYADRLRQIEESFVSHQADKELNDRLTRKGK